MRFKNIIFDFDGTLVDSKPGVIESFRKAVKELSGKETDKQKITQLIGCPLTQIISVLLDTKDHALIGRGSELFKKYYNEGGVYQNTIYPGIKETLELLKSQSRQLFVVSNKIELFMDEILRQHDIKEYFISILGTDGTDEKSKKTKYIGEIVKKYKLENQQTAIIGDTKEDISAGKNNSIYTVGITWGYGSESDLVEAGADAVYHNVSEIKNL